MEVCEFPNDLKAYFVVDIFLLAYSIVIRKIYQLFFEL